MSDAVSIERQKILKARGADILLTPGHLGTDGAIEEAYRLARENPVTYFLPDQFNMDINDLDDKAVSGSEKANVSLTEFTEANISQFKKDLSVLGITPANAYARASEHVDLDDYEKQNPRDFTLFKRSKLSELKRGIFVKTPWGNVRPSWHIKSSAISMKFLGECFDIHSSSRELIFPHHENENAIAAAITGKSLAKYWIHCDRVLSAGKKLDEKSASLTLADLMNMGYSGRVIRFWLLSSHYRKPIPFSKERLDNAKRALERLDRCLLKLCSVKQGQPYAEREQLLYNLKTGFSSAMDDDLNISAALATIFTVVKKVNGLILVEDQ